ncbi:hypothetical protein [Amycolatopsis pithecellobii]|uniref:Uncharacterized protein n=1 Tax=Amycolatopsis pithecellobii TaxID=664692 RepID=A0A6N7Z4A0_9PSEU|nr:hypothetical protein [Amycolatopsis pithecellobii]MTD55104.1 hypothetical protein [Amycolatopsis pithecellobii]
MRAGELRFDEKPHTDIRFSGTPGHQPLTRSDRTNLPDRVDAGVEYRDVRIEYRLENQITPSAPAVIDHERVDGRN